MATGASGCSWRPYSRSRSTAAKAEKPFSTSLETKNKDNNLELVVRIHIGHVRVLRVAVSAGDVCIVDVVEGNLLVAVHGDDMVAKLASYASSRWSSDPTDEDNERNEFEAARRIARA